MRLINLIIVFVMVSGLILFSLENQSPVTVRVVPGRVDLQLPLCIALVAAMGIGGLLISALGVWIDLQNRIARGRDRKQIREQKKQIESLQEDLGRYKVDLDKRQQLDKLQDQLETYKAAMEEEQRLLPGD